MLIKQQQYTEKELFLVEKFKRLKQDAGSHSPSIFTFKQKLPELNIKIDACFLSNPYATDLFLEYFTKEIIETGRIRELLEFYPSQNQVIAEIIANFLNIDSKNVFIGNGAIEIIQAVIHNFTKRKIIINIPTFSSYYEFVRPGIEVVYNKLDSKEQYHLNVDNYIELVKKNKPDTLVIINPNNPDGGYIEHNAIKRILDHTKDVETVIIDESFIHFAYEDASFNPINTTNFIEQYPNLVIIKSMSKDFGIAGIRAGYALMSVERIQTLLNHGYLWNSNGLSEYFFRLYSRKDFAADYNKVRVQYIRETIDFIKELNKISGINVFSSMANFVLIELKNGIKADDFVTVLLIKYGIYVRTCSDKIGLEGEFIRLASRTKQENEYIIESFKDYFNNI